MRKTQSALFIMGLALFVWLLLHLGIGEIWRQLAVMGWGMLPLILSEGLANLAHAIAWSHCLCGRNPRLGLGLLFRISLAGYAINFLTPSASLGGEVARASLLSSHQGGAAASASVLIDKVSGAIGHLLLILSGTVLVIWKVKLPPFVWVSLAVSNALITAGITAFLLLQRQGKLGQAARWLSARRRGNQSLARLAAELSKVDGLLKSFHQSRSKDLLRSIAWHALGHAAAVFQAWLFLRIIDPAGSLVQAVLASVLCLWFDFATFAVPLSIGTLEGSRIVALKAIGLGAVAGMTYSMAQRIAQLFWGTMGLLTYFLFVRKTTHRQRDFDLPKRKSLPGRRTKLAGPLANCRCATDREAYCDPSDCH